MSTPAIILDDLDRNLSREEALALIDFSLEKLLPAAARRRDAAHGSIVSYSRKVFIPLTQLCRDVCHYCTFAHPPRKNERAYLSLEDVLAIARAGQAAGCKEALFTLGDQPERRYRAAADELARLGHPTTLSYLAQAARAVHDATGLLPHLNPGHLTPADVAALRGVSVSQGLMLESASERLCAPGGPHHGSPDKQPRRGRRARAVPLGHPDRHRRNARGADRFAPRPARARRRLWPPPGNHHPEFPAESRNPHGRVASAIARGAFVDHRGRAPFICAVDEHPGSAEPQSRRSAALDRCGHQRLGRGVAGHARSRQPGGAVAGAGCARARHCRGRQATGG